jgi:uncharacterized protein (TIGR02246 family)
VVPAERGRIVGDDEDQVRRTLAEYSQWCDDGEFGSWAELFTQDARLVLGGQATEGRGAIRRYMEQLQPPEARGKHITSNTTIAVVGDVATATTDYLFVRATPTGLALIAAGRYVDELVRGEDRWRFSQREITLLLPAGADTGD